MPRIRHSSLTAIHLIAVAMLIAHLLHNCAMRVRAHFKNIDEIIATIMAAIIKNKDRKKDFHDAGLPSPPDPVITR